MTLQVKYTIDGSIEKYKACFAARGFSQKEGINFEETFAPIARYTLVRVVIVITGAKGWKIHQMDVKIVFLNGTIEEEVYLEQPKGFVTHDVAFVTHDVASYVCKLKKALYRLKQAP